MQLRYLNTLDAVDISNLVINTLMCICIIKTSKKYGFLISVNVYILLLAMQ